MEARTKVILFRVLFVLVVFVISGGFIYQKLQDKQNTTSPPQQEQQESKQTSAETVFPTENKTKDKQPSEDRGGKLADYYSTDQINTSKKVAENFVRALYPFDGNNVFKGTQEAMSFANQNLKKMMESEEAGITRPTANVFSRELKTIEVKEPEVAMPDAITLDVTVTGDIKNQKGVITDKDTTNYLVLLTKENNEYKVAEYSIDPNE